MKKVRALLPFVPLLIHVLVLVLKGVLWDCLKLGKRYCYKNHQLAIKYCDIVDDDVILKFPLTSVEEYYMEGMRDTGRGSAYTWRKEVQ